MRHMLLVSMVAMICIATPGFAVSKPKSIQPAVGDAQNFLSALNIQDALLNVGYSLGARPLSTTIGKPAGGIEQITPNTQYTYPVTVYLDPPDTDCQTDENGETYCEFQYFFWALVDKNGNIKDGGESTLVDITSYDGTYSTDITVTTPSREIGTYAIVVVALEANATYDFDNQRWEYGQNKCGLNSVDKHLYYFNPDGTLSNNRCEARYIVSKDGFKFDGTPVDISPSTSGLGQLISHLILKMLGWIKAILSGITPG